MTVGLNPRNLLLEDVIAFFEHHRAQETHGQRE